MSVSPHDLQRPLKLRCGFVLKNRIAKAALSENQCFNSGNNPNERLLRLSKRWAEGGLGMILTGHVIVSKDGMAEKGNVVVRHDSDESAIADWATSLQSAGSPAFVQLNHAGRQVPRFLSTSPIAPSAIGVAKSMNQFATPREMTQSDIDIVIADFGSAALKVKNAGFSGVEIHSAHGYLCAQFLSKKTNKRNDNFGGCLENRMRFLVSVYREIRGRCGPSFPVGVKLNVSDFLHGGFEFSEALLVAEELDKLGIDFIELSGGTYEKPMFALPTAESTRSREAYFFEYATKVKSVLGGDSVVILTGGLRTPKFMDEVISDGIADMVGIGRPLIVEPLFAKNVLAEGRTDSSVLVKSERSRAQWIAILRKVLPNLLTSVSELAWFNMQMDRMAVGKDPVPNASSLMGIAYFIFTMFFGKKEVGRHR